MYRMYNKKNNLLVYVYNFYNNTALCYCPSLAGRQNGNGWTNTHVKNLIPEEYWDPTECCFTSPNQKNLARHEAEKIIKEI